MKGCNNRFKIILGRFSISLSALHIEDVKETIANCNSWRKGEVQNKKQKEKEVNGKHCRDTLNLLLGELILPSVT